MVGVADEIMTEPAALAASPPTKPSDFSQTSISGRGTNLRVSEAAGRAQMMAGGLGYIARRNVPYNIARLLRTTGGIDALAEFQPLYLLVLLADLVPEVSQAVFNILVLGCNPECMRLKAVVYDNEGTANEDAGASFKIKQYYRNQPAEAGDFYEKLAENTLMVLFSGMAAVESVPGPEMTGNSASWTIDTLTLSARRDKQTDALVWDQRQTTPQITATGTAPAAIPTVATNLVPMPMNRFFTAKMHSFPGDPYGRAVFAAALQPILDYLGFIRDLTIAFHRVGLPRYDVEFDFVTATIQASQKGLANAVDIANEVKREFNNFKNDFNQLNTDDTFFHPKGTMVNTTGGGKDMPDVESIFDVYRYRVIIGLKQNPVLMSFVEGSTETWSDIQWDLASKGLEVIMGVAVGPLKDDAQLHLRLSGMPQIVEYEFKPVRSLTRLQDAQAERIELDNTITKRDQNFIDQETAGMEATGSKPVGPAPVQVAPDPVTGDQNNPPAPATPGQPAKGKQDDPPVATRPGTGGSPGRPSKPNDKGKPARK